jgi:DivIVA domain-containing protein
LTEITILVRVTDIRFQAADPDFVIVLRGYDRAQVDAAVRVAHDALLSGDSATCAEAATDLAGIAFDVRLRGYDRNQVDDYLQRMGAALASTSP